MPHHGKASAKVRFQFVPLKQRFNVSGLPVIVAPAPPFARWHKGRRLCGSVPCTSTSRGYHPE